MDLKIIGTTFMTLFLAEMGDKTQLAVLSLTAASRQPLSVFVGAVSALLLARAGFDVVLLDRSELLGLGDVVDQGGVIPAAAVPRVATSISESSCA